MLVLSRKINEQIQIGDDITVTIVRVKGKAVGIGIEAPQQVRILRSELPRKHPERPSRSSEPTSPLPPDVSADAAQSDPQATTGTHDDPSPGFVDARTDRLASDREVASMQLLLARRHRRRPGLSLPR
jgi:carbon storage regulator CsrA